MLKSENKLTYFTMGARSTKMAWNSRGTLISLLYDWKQVWVNDDGDLFNLPNSISLDIEQTSLNLPFCFVLFHSSL